MALEEFALSALVHRMLCSCQHIVPRMTYENAGQVIDPAHCKHDRPAVSAAFALLTGNLTARGPGDSQCQDRRPVGGWQWLRHGIAVPTHIHGTMSLEQGPSTRDQLLVLLQLIMVAGTSEDAARRKMRQAFIIVIVVTLECWTAAAPLPFGPSGARGREI
jgi:hypothetical protein